ncbi:Peptidyl-prolyl cis-trans isomerase FKBP17-1, chloroplastic [Linum perenne]
MAMKCLACRLSPSSYAPYHFTIVCRAESKPPSPPVRATSSMLSTRRNALAAASVVLSSFSFVAANPASSSSSSITKFFDVPDSGGVKALDLRVGTGAVPSIGNQSDIFECKCLKAFVHVISGIESAVKSMKVGGIRRVVIPPSQGYQNTSQEPLPPNFFDRQRLFTTIFNPTRLANGEGSTLGTLIFDIELVSLRN